MQTSILNLGKLFTSASPYALSDGSTMLAAYSWRKSSAGRELRDAVRLIVPAHVWRSFQAAHPGPLPKGAALEVTAEGWHTERIGYHDAALAIHVIALHLAPARHAAVNANNSTTTTQDPA